MPRNDGIFSFFAAALPAQIMNNFLSPDVINSFLGRTVEAFPENPSACTPSCEAVGRSWQRLGLRPGDVVLICLPSGKELMNQFFGVLLARGVPALAPPNMPAARLRELRQEFGARAIVAYRLPPVEFRGQTHEEFGGLRVAMFPPAQEPAAAAGEVVLLTSGTSGFASGCVFDFEALLLNGRRHADSIGQRQEDVVLVSLPLYFSFALVAQALASLVRGNRMIISGPPFNAARYQRTLREFGVTVSSLTPVLVRSLLQTDGDFLGELRVFSVGGDYAEPELVARLVDVREGGGALRYLWAYAGWSARIHAGRTPGTCSPVQLRGASHGRHNGLPAPGERWQQVGSVVRNFRHGDETSDRVGRRKAAPRSCRAANDSHGRRVRAGRRWLSLLQGAPLRLHQQEGRENQFGGRAPHGLTASKRGQRQDPDHQAERRG